MVMAYYLFLPLDLLKENLFFAPKISETKNTTKKKDITKPFLSLRFCVLVSKHEKKGIDTKYNLGSLFSGIFRILVFSKHES